MTTKPCGRQCTVFSRVTGYLRPVYKTDTHNSQWNPGKREEFRQRRLYDLSKSTAPGAKRQTKGDTP
jgi:anaerobic ribonucleoside-triphosphate reductase